MDDCAIEVRIQRSQSRNLAIIVAKITGRLLERDSLISALWMRDEGMDALQSVEKLGPGSNLQKMWMRR